MQRGSTLSVLLDLLNRKFDFFAVITMCLVMLVVMVESTGMFLAVGEMTDRKIERPDLTRGLLTDGLATLVGGILNTFPYTSFSQNVGLVGVTGIKRRWVTVAGGVMLLIFGLIRSSVHWSQRSHYLCSAGQASSCLGW